MTYKTLEYNVNSPCLKQVVEPLDSAYGLAIRVVKDGQVVPLVAQGDIVVDGQDSVRLKNGWQLFELSSGSSNGRMEYDVKAVKEASVYADIHETCLSGNSTARDKTSNLIPWNLYDTSLAEKRLYAKDIKKYETDAIISTSTQVSSFVVPLENTGFSFSNGVYYYPVDGMWCLRAGSEYVPSQEYFDVSSSVPVRAQLKMPAHSDVSVVLNLNVDSGDGIDSEFSLVVQEQDLGYIEPAVLTGYGQA